jgi:hypothetical protein
MKKLKNEKELVKKAIAEGMKYGAKRLSTFIASWFTTK